MIDGSTRVFALLGDPVAHSLSPAMQNAAFRALGLPAVYVPLRCSRDDIPPLVRALTRAGGGGNVTVPHKEAAAVAVDHCLEAAQVAGACNTFWGEDGRTVGDNTDVAGVLAALDRLDAPGGPWLVAGTGGGARAAIIAAARRGVAVAICSRSEPRRQSLERWAAERGVAVASAAEARVLINATPLGLSAGDPLPFAPGVAPDAEVALDMVYSVGETPWVRSMREKGLRSADGRVMLLAQGAAALERWFPGTQAPLEVMGAALDAALR